MKLTFFADDDALGGIILALCCCPSFNMDVGLGINDVAGRCGFIVMGDFGFCG